MPPESESAKLPPNTEESSPPNITEPLKWLGYHFTKDWGMIKKAPIALLALFVFSVIVAWMFTWKIVVPAMQVQIDAKQGIIDQKQSDIDSISKRLDNSERDNTQLRSEIAQSPSEHDEKIQGLMHENEQKDLLLEALKITAGLTNAQIPKIDFHNGISVSKTGDALGIDFNYTVTNDEPVEKLVISASMTQGNAKFLNFVSMGGAPNGQGRVTISPDQKTCSLMLFPTDRFGGELWMTISGPGTINLTSPLLEDQIKMQVSATNIIFNDIKYQPTN